MATNLIHTWIVVLFCFYYAKFLITSLNLREVELTWAHYLRGYIHFDP